MKHKQNKIIYMITSIGNSDESVDWSDESPSTFNTMLAAIEAARNVTEEYGLRTYVYECIPVTMIDRGEVRITVLPSDRKVKRGGKKCRS